MMKLESFFLEKYNQWRKNVKHGLGTSLSLFSWKNEGIEFMNSNALNLNSGKENARWGLHEHGFILNLSKVPNFLNK